MTSFPIGKVGRETKVSDGDALTGSAYNTGDHDEDEEQGGGELCGSRNKKDRAALEMEGKNIVKEYHKDEPRIGKGILKPRKAYVGKARIPEEHRGEQFVPHAINEKHHESHEEKVNVGEEEVIVPRDKHPRPEGHSQDQIEERGNDVDHRESVDSLEGLPVRNSKSYLFI